MRFVFITSRSCFLTSHDITFAAFGFLPLQLRIAVRLACFGKRKIVRSVPPSDLDPFSSSCAQFSDSCGAFAVQG